MKKIFIYYSLSGNGDIIAHELKKLGYDIRKVETSEPLPKNYILSILTGGYKAMINYEDKLVDFDNNVDDYQKVIIGSPIWNDRLSSPINTVLKSTNLQNKHVKFILYSGKGRTKKAEKMIKSKYIDVEIINLREPKNNKEELSKLKID